MWPYQDDPPHTQAVPDIEIDTSTLMMHSQDHHGSNKVQDEPEIQNGTEVIIPA